MRKELNQTEVYLKEQYIKFGSDSDTEILRLIQNGNKDKEPLKNLAQIITQDRLRAEDFFEEDEAVAIYQHIRYLPKKMHSHDFFELIYVYSGNATNIIGTETSQMNEGDICILSPDTPHALTTFSDDTIIYNILIRNEAFENEFMNVVSNNDSILSKFFGISLIKNISSYIYFDTNNDQNLKQFMDYVISEYQLNRKYRSEMITNLLNGFFIILLRNHEDHSYNSQIMTDSKNDQILEIIRYIQNNYSNLSLKAVATQFSYSERHISRIIKHYSSYSFSEFLMDIKLSKAKSLIHNSTMPIEDIAAFVGYADLSNFYRLFKKKYSCTPASLRRRN